MNVSDKKKPTKRCCTHVRRGAASLACILPLMAEPAGGQDKARGQELARSLCANCHFGAHLGDRTGRSGVPTFSAIANREAQTFHGVVLWLRSVPSVMPNHRLTQDEILDLADFIMSLRVNH
jgi:mono/diheme cytochrome c family protein